MQEESYSLRVKGKGEKGFLKSGRLKIQNCGLWIWFSFFTFIFEICLCHFLSWWSWENVLVSLRLKALHKTTGLHEIMCGKHLAKGSTRDHSLIHVIVVHHANKGPLGYQKCSCKSFRLSHPVIIQKKQAHFCPVLFKLIKIFKV